MTLLFQAREDKGINSKFNVRCAFLSEEVPSRVRVQPSTDFQLSGQKQKSPAARARCWGTDMPVVTGD